MVNFSNKRSSNDCGIVLARLKMVYDEIAISIDTTQCELRLFKYDVLLYCVRWLVSTQRDECSFKVEQEVQGLVESVNPNREISNNIY